MDRHTGRFSGRWGTFDSIRPGQRLVALNPATLDPIDAAEELTLLEPGR